MASSKKIGFFWSEDQITLVEADKNEPLRIVSSHLEQKDSTASPFSSSFTEEIQVTASLQKILQDSRMSGKEIFLSLPMKEIILRSFVIPFVKKEDLANAIKFEAKKYLPLDIQDLTFVFYTTPFTDENKVQRLQVVFFAVRRETLEKYERIVKQVNAELSYCEPWAISLAKLLLFKKEIRPSDHMAFLILEKNSGTICFINQGIPQFVREFAKDGSDNLKILNEVGNSFDFYARQFNSESLTQVLVSGQEVDDALLTTLGTELKLKLKRFSAAKVLGGLGSSDAMEPVYAWGACVTPPMPSQARFNFVDEKKPKVQSQLVGGLKTYRQTVFILGICLLSLFGLSLFFQSRIKTAQDHLKQLSEQEGVYSAVDISVVKQDLQDNTDKLNAYKAVRTRSRVNVIILKIASHLPVGVRLSKLDLAFNPQNLSDDHPAITMEGQVYNENSDAELGMINQIGTDLKKDKDLAPYIKNVNVASLDTDKTTDNRLVTRFVIHCS